MTDLDAIAGFENTRSFYMIHNLMRYFIRLDFWILRWDGEKIIRWMDLGHLGHAPVMAGFENRFGKSERRLKHLHRNIQKALRTNTPILGRTGELCDIFIPIQRKGGMAEILTCGQFLREPMGEGDLAAAWRELSGRSGAPTSADYQSFCRTLLSLPVYDEALIRGVRTFARELASYLAGRSKVGMDKRLDQLRKSVFAGKVPHPFWGRQLIGLDRYGLPARGGRTELDDWEKEELGIQQVPTTVMAIMPMEKKAGWTDPVGALVRGNRIQKACFQLAQSRGDAYSEPYGEQGVYLLSATRSNQVDSKLELRSRADVYREFVKQEFGLDCAIGIGHSQPAGEILDKSRQEAQMALHLAMRDPRRVLFWGRETGSDHRDHFGRSLDLSEKLIGALETLSTDELNELRDRYTRMVLEHACDQPEVVRGWFSDMLVHMALRVQKKSMEPDKIKELYLEEIHEGLRGAGSTHQMVEFFNQAVAVFADLGARGAVGANAARFESTLRYLKQNFRENLRLPDVAARAGFSVPVFTRTFRENTGTTFVSYLQELRVDFAKSLLSNGILPVEQVGLLAGFETSRHFARVFRKLAGKAPSEYRQAFKHRLMAVSSN